MILLAFWAGLTIGALLGVAFAPPMRGVYRRLCPTGARGVVIRRVRR